MLCVVALFFNNNCPRIHELKQTHKNKYQVIFYILSTKPNATIADMGNWEKGNGSGS